MIRLRLQRMRGEEGLALALALIFVLVMALVVTALLPYTSAGLRAAGAAREVRTVQNAADGAVDQAINAIRGSFSAGASPLCASGSEAVLSSADYPNSAPDTGVTETRVTYCNTGTAGTFDDQPPYAIQTLDGGVSASGNAPLVVTGGLLSSGDVVATGEKQAVAIEGDLYARGSCTAKDVFVVTGEHICANTAPAFGASEPDPTDDPFDGLTEPALSSLAAVDPLGVCPGGPTSVVRFSPGLYTQNPIPDPSSCTGNKHTTWWFQPGVYYFDFPDSAFTSTQFGGFTNDDAAFRAGGITIVGGVPENWDPDTSSSTDVADLFTKDPDQELPACATSSAGVVFTFGGPTNISVGTGGQAPEHLELCSRPYETQQLSLFGLRDAPTRTSTASDADDAAETAASSTYSPANSGREIDSAPATYLLIGGVAKEAALQLSDLDELATTVPDGALITSFKLRLNYWASSELGTAVAAKVDHAVTYASDGLPATTVALPDYTTQPSADGGHVIDVDLAGDDVRWRSFKNALSNLSVTFSADGGALDAARVRPVRAPEQATTYLNGVHVEVAYIPPAVEKVRCPSGVSDCNLLTNKVDDSLFLHGTVYTPLSDLQIGVHNYSSTIFERGIIASSLDITVSASAKQTLPPFQLPRGPNDRLVRFTAQSKEPNGTWRSRVVALVQYEDLVQRPDGTTSASPGFDVRVLRWNVIR